MRLLPFLFCLISGALSIDWNFFSFPSLHKPEHADPSPIIEVVRWQQPVCLIAATGVPPCLVGVPKSPSSVSSQASSEVFPNLPETFSEARAKTLSSSELRGTINLAEIEPSSFSDEELRERNDGTPILDDLSLRQPRQAADDDKRVFIDGRPTSSPPPIYVTRVQKSPVTATLIALNCFPDIGVPTCDELERKDQPCEPSTPSPSPSTETQPQEPERKKPLLDYLREFIYKGSYAAKNATESLGDKIKSKLDFEILTNKTQALAEKKEEYAKEAAKKKDDLLKELAKKKDAALQEAADKKQSVVSALASAAAEKQKLVQGIINKTHNVVQELQEKKDKVVETLTNATAYKHKIVQGFVERKQEAVKTLVDQAQNVVQDMIDTKTSLSQDIASTKQNIVQTIADTKANIVQNVAGAKQAIVKQLGDSKAETIKKLSEKTQEYIGTASIIKPFFISSVVGSANSDANTGNEGFEVPLDEQLPEQDLTNEQPDDEKLAEEA